MNYLGFGAGAHSFYDDGVRRSNNRDVMPYMNPLTDILCLLLIRRLITLERAQEGFLHF